MRVRRAGLASGVIALAIGGGFAAAVGATAPPSSTPPTSTAAPTTSGPATTLQGTTQPATTQRATTTTVPPVDLLAGVPWIQRVYASPCSETNVQMIGGSAVDGSSLAVLDDVVPLDPTGGLAVAFLSCHAADGSTTESTALLVRVSPSAAVASVAEQELGPGARVVAADLPSFTVEAPQGTPADGSCCAPLTRRRSYSVSPAGFEVTADAQVATFLQTIAPPAVGGDGDLVRASVPAAALCYRWENVYLSPADPESEPPAVEAPSAELQTVRLALIHVTGRWITPASVMTAEMSDVVREYQESRGLTVDGQVGAETTSSLSTDLGCTANGDFRQIVPSGIGPRRYGSVADLVAVMQRYARVGSTGNASLDAMLDDAGWDAANSMFLGCYRWETPPSGMSCSWSGRTPLQLIGLVEDPSSPGIGVFSILYARSAG